MTTPLSKNKYWDNIHKDKSLRFANIWVILEGLQNFEYFHTIKKYLKADYKNIFEVWCAPWNYLIRFHKRFWLSPNWIEYAHAWFEKTIDNLKINNIEWNIIFGDFFDKNFLLENKEKFDVVYSIWFIEHFEKVDEVIANHFAITKNWWLVIIAIPNLQYINGCFAEKSMLNIHNLAIMDIEVLHKYFHEYEILEIKYIGWLLNIGLLHYKNPLIEVVRFSLFILQRLLLDPVFILLRQIGINLSNKYSSPQILIVCRK